MLHAEVPFAFHVENSLMNSELNLHRNYYDKGDSRLISKICREIPMKWGSTKFATILIAMTVEAKATGSSLKEQKRPIRYITQTTTPQDTGSGAIERPSNQGWNQTQIKGPEERCGLTKNKCWSKIRKTLQARREDKIQHSLTRAGGTKKREITLQPAAIAVLTSLGLLLWIMGAMSLILTSRGEQGSFSSGRTRRRPGS